MPKTDDEILALIQAAEGPAAKAQLSVLYHINKTLVQNTELTIDAVDRLQKQETAFADHRVEFAQHVTDEQLLFNRGIGAWKAVAIGSMVVVSLFGVIGSLGIYILNNNISDVKATANEVKITAARNAEQDTAIKVLEAEVKSVQDTQSRNTFLLDNALVRSPIQIAPQRVAPPNTRR